MKLGFCTTDYRTPRKPDELFRQLHGFGFEAVQLTMATLGLEEIPARIPRELLREIRSRLDAYGIELSAMNGTFNMAHPEKREREKYLDRYEVLLEAAAELGCPVLSLCTGSRNTQSMWMPHPDNNTPEAWEDMLDAVGRAVEKAERYPVVLAVETEPSNVVNTPEKARRLLDDIHSDSLKMIMDCANLFSAGLARKDNAAPVIRGAFEAFGKEVVLAHSKDVLESDVVKFCATGQGIVDYDLFLSLLRQHGYTGPMIMHGIYDEALIPGCMAFMKEAMARAGL